MEQRDTVPLEYGPVSGLLLVIGVDLPSRPAPPEIRRRTSTVVVGWADLNRLDI